MEATRLNPKQLFHYLATTAIPAKLPVLIEGAPGVGKTEIVHQAAETAGADVLDFYAACSDPTDPKGMPATWRETSTNPDGTTTHTQRANFIPFGFLERLIHAPRPLVFFEDDIGGATPATQLSLMNLNQARRTGDGTPIADNVIFIAATNRRTDRAGVQGLLEPFKSRFSTIVELVPDTDQWCQWALQKGVPIELIQFIRFRPGMLNDFQPTADMSNSPSPRTVYSVARQMLAGCPKELEYPIFSGAAGEAFAAEFIGFLKIFRSLPNPDAVLLRPRDHDLPSDPATLYALCGALARRASETNFDAVCTVADRLTNELAAKGGAEFSVVLVKDAITLAPKLTATKAFISWATTHAELLI